MSFHAHGSRLPIHCWMLSPVFAVGCVLIAAATQSSPQNPGKLPTTSEVLERYVEVTGGREALLRHKSMTIRGRYQEPAQKLDLETISYTKDGKLFAKAFLPEGKEYATGYDGQTAWSIAPDGKVAIQEGDVVKSVARDADMYYHLHVMDYFKTLEVVDVKEFNGRPCFHLKGVNNWGRFNEQFYDQENGLLLGYAFNTAWRRGKGDATATFEDYKDFGGILMPVKTTSRDGDDLSISIVTSVTYDNVDGSVFVLPEGVKKAMASKTTSKP